jgi:hypothetical protein
MTSTIRNSAVLRAVRPQDVAVYLQARRWREQERREGEYAIWQRTADDEPVEILLPLNTAYRDYAARIAGVLQTLEAVEQRSQLDILADIQTVGCDTIHVSAEGEALAGGAISLHGGTLFIAGVQNLMLPAACSAVQPRPVFDDPVPEAAMAYVQQVRISMGRGSFMVSIKAPVDLEATQTHIGKRKASFARRTTLILMQSLSVVRDALDRSTSGDTIETLLEVAPGGISANLCYALVDLYRGSLADQIRFSVAWSPLRRVPHDAVSDVTIPAGVVPLLQDASRLLRETTLREGFILPGFVVGLEPESDDRLGRAIIAGLIDGDLHQVECDLTGTHYHRARRAFDRRQVIRCTGDLVQSGERYMLHNPRNVTLLDEES